MNAYKGEANSSGFTKRQTQKEERNFKNNIASKDPIKITLQK